ncbi:ABC transporter substrate-binding protein [Clostridium fallax]|uniref:Carbohydrate ABC transporter substrate-binding protein, CUT1 family n=1 Tax=Clostridium fallax TaxID=1533 RepID=A0A1M4VU98_9CLOT|nr:ABC transporter substrate-binding protein [Clostridium fallax]SHE72392.1 carbohydrate ABC transporter substrate-binding protein, CUT1 family [Clostridium fallax]SQB07690.1 ABC transporter substrate-binding protein [Clostridium fallax]
MTKFKKLFALSMGVVMASSVALTGCGEKKDAAGDKGEAVNLVWYTIGAPQKDTKKVTDELNKYLKDKINATVEMKQIDFGDYTKKMQVIINSGEEYDIAFACSWANDYLLNSRKGAFIPIDDLLDKYGKETKETVDKRFWEGAKVNGKIYGVPTNKEIGVMPEWVFTKEYVDKYNIPYKDIHSLQDLEPWLQKIKENEPDVTPLYITKDYSIITQFDKLMDPIGVKLNDKDLKVVNVFDTPEMKKDLETMRSYYEKGYINKDAATAQADKTVKRFIAKADGQPFAETLWSKDLGYEVVSSKIIDPYVSNGSTTGSLQCISATSKHPEKAMEFLNLLNTDPYVRNMVNFGLEGTHYEKISDNKIKLTDDSKNYQVPYFSLGNLFITYLLESDPDNKWEEFKKCNEEAKASPALGFNFDPTNVTTEIAAVKNILDEFGPSLYSGSVPVDEYVNKMNEKLKAAGIDKIITEMQKQIDEWKTSK